MRKLFLSALLILAALSACQKNELSAPVTKGEVIYATIEDVASTRTVKDENNNIRWSEGDQIIAFMNSTLGVKYQVLPSSVGKTSASFEEVSTGGLNAGTELDHIVAYYPYSSSVKIARSGDNYTLNAVLPSEQIYASESFGNGAFPMIAVSSTNNLTFKNICGAMKLQLKGTQKVASIKVEGKNYERISGAAAVTAYAEGNKPAIAMSSDASTSVVLDCGSGVQLNETEATEFIVTLPPTLFTKGFVVTISDAAGNRSLIETDKSNEVRRSSVLVMPAVILESGDIIPQERDYVDEYGINHGQGVEIDGVVWAPVNCGYHATDYKYGKLYQWGRKYGQGYDGEVAATELVEGPVNIVEGESKDNENKFYVIAYSPSWPSCDWCMPSSEHLWNLGTTANPVKTEYDPCPNGWRVPTYKELSDLIDNYSIWTDNNGCDGRYFCGSNMYDDIVPATFFPAAGYRSYQKGTVSSRDYRSRYWSSSLRGYRPYHLWDSNAGYVDIDYEEHRSNGFSVRCVQDDKEMIPVESVALNKTSLTLPAGCSEILYTTIIPSNANHQFPYWLSYDPGVASVDAEGKVTAVAAGTTIIVAMAGMQTAVCEVIVPTSIVRDYVDEYGVNHGPGVEIDGIVWAPVNCGYHSVDYKYGKLYQWGRKYGQGYGGELYDVNMNQIGTYSDAVLPVIDKAPVSISVGNDLNNANRFYITTINENWNWASSSSSDLWNFNDESLPIKTEYDPCPDGWRVPSYAELDQLVQNSLEWSVNSFGQEGLSIKASDGLEVFLPASGCISQHDGNGERRGFNGYYFSSLQWASFKGYAWLLSFYPDNVYINTASRACGCSIRCVQE